MLKFHFHDMNDQKNIRIFLFQSFKTDILRNIHFARTIKFLVDKYRHYMFDAQTRVKPQSICHYVLLYMQTEFLR